jgi:hypothetical protein
MVAGRPARLPDAAPSRARGRRLPQSAPARNSRRPPPARKASDGQGPGRDPAPPPPCRGRSRPRTTRAGRCRCPCPVARRSARPCCVRGRRWRRQACDRTRQESLLASDSSRIARTGLGGRVQGRPRAGGCALAQRVGVHSGSRSGGRVGLDRAGGGRESMIAWIRRFASLISSFSKGNAWTPHGSFRFVVLVSCPGVADPAWRKTCMVSPNSRIY